MALHSASRQTTATQPLLSRLAMKLRASIGRHLLSDHLGRVAGWAFRQKIPHRGLSVSTASALVSDGVRTALILRAYESAEYRFVERFIPTDADVIELGASIGVMTCHLLRRVESNSRVISVEADARLLPLIRDNVARNCDRPATLVNRAVHYGDQKQVEFTFGDDTLGGRIDASAMAGATAVEAVTLRHLVDEFRCTSYSVVADIEGAEWDLWEHDQASLSGARACVFELHDSFDGRPLQHLFERIRDDPGFEVLGRYGSVVAFRPRAARP